MITRWLPTLTAVVLALATQRAAAQSPNTDRSFRPGANHHTGDDAFEAQYGRAPRLDDERLRVHTHFLAVRDWLASRPATRPELAARRAQILRYFDAYIAKGTTPDNAHLPWRTPVFIDDRGTICAVGYLIEQSVGRPVADKIAKAHRYAYLEEIAGAMPEVRDWVESSGLTLEELSTIQPGYMAPIVETWQAWDLAKAKLPDGAFVGDDGTLKGTIVKGEMEGTWTRVDAKQHLIGSGEFTHGKAAWTSAYADGKTLAQGRYVDNQPHGTWQFFHASGALAAEGKFDHGKRNGTWHFYYDSPAKTPIAIGGFKHGTVDGTWKHFDAAGTLLATSRDATPSQWSYLGSSGGYLLEIVPGADGIRHQIHQGDVGGDHHRLDGVISADGKERLYVQAHSDVIYDANGDSLSRVDGAWHSSNCKWNRARKAAARSGDVSRLHGLIFHDWFDHAPACVAPTAVTAERGKRIDLMLASIRAVRAQTPDFVRKLALGEVTVEDATTDNTDDSSATAEAANLSDDSNDLGMTDPNDLAKVLAANMTWYVEWPHVDGRFIEVFKTLAGYEINNG